ncbi:MAG TPA: hypothetical protein VFP42_14460 [Acidimicrobiia bacterium]|nr:hypothetical protein [Acidimicrobiia bacterium]
MKRLIALLFAGLLVFVGCSGNGLEDVASDLEDATDATVSDEVEQNALELAADVEEQMDTLTEEIQSSGAAEELQSAWSEVQTEMTAAIASMQADGTMTVEGIEEALDDFQTEIEAAGDEIAPELRSAWDSLRTSIQELIS